jgi:ADP-ribose pyrophosphatase YjhB (NUDIX family)
LARLTRPKAKPGERDQLLVSGLPVVEDPAAVLYVPRRANAATAASPPRGVAAAEPIGAPASDAVHREPIARSPERTGPFETGFPAKEADYPLSPWMATYVPETGLIYTEARQLDVQWVFRPNYDRRNATKVVMIAPGIHVISAFGVKDAVFDLQGRPVTAIMDLRRRLLSPQRLANRLNENIGLDERSYTPGQPIALLAEHTAAGGRDSFAQRLANEMHVPVYGLQGSYDERQWLLCFPDAVSHPVWQPDTTASRLRLPGGGQPMRVKWTLLELRTSSDLEVWAADDPVKLDRFLAPQGMFVINGHTNELVGRGASSVAASARAAGHVPGKPVLLMTTRADIAGEPFTGELADELQSPILIMTDPAWGPGGKAVRKNTVTVSRVEGAQNRRITIDENGSVTFNDTEKNKGSLVWLNFGPMERSLDYFERKRGAMDDVVIHTFDVPRTLLDTFRRNAVDQLPGNEGKLLLGDWRQVPDQFGLPWDDALRLVGQIIPGSAKTVVVPPRKSGSGDGSVGARPAANASGATVQPIPTASKKLEPQIHPRPDEFGEPVTINAPTEPTDESSWRDPARIAVFVPDGAYPESLNGIPMRPWDPPTTVEGWQSVAGQKEDLVEPERTERVRKAGVVIAEPDGRYWIIETTNHFADGARTFPKGGADAGLSLQATAIKEAYEETGLHVQIDAFLVDVNSRKTKSKVKTRYYLAHRIGGTPAAMGWEAQGVYLVPRALMGETVRTSRDKQIWWEVSRRENDAKLGPGEAAASD